jgi:oligopeptide transport system ATP-binding protein
MTEPLLRAERLVKHFEVRSGFFGRAHGAVQAVDDVSFELYPGETLALVGESGCGKSTTGKLLLRLIEPTAGKVWFDGRELYTLSDREVRSLRREMQVIFQDPYGSLNPRMTVGDMLAEALRLHGLHPGRERHRVVELLGLVGLAPEHAARYAHEFSGGQRQRIAIARALTLKPELLICDESVSALDVSVQAQLLNLLQDLQDEYAMSYLFISHDLAVVRYMADEVMVMKDGEVVEIAGPDELYANPKHPYTRLLLSSIPARAH